jgi:hypothetical protein
MTTLGMAVPEIALEREKWRRTATKLRNRPMDFLQRLLRLMEAAHCAQKGQTIVMRSTRLQ